MPALVVLVSYKMTRYTIIAIGVIIIISDGRQKDDPARWPPPKIATAKDCCWCASRNNSSVCVCVRAKVCLLFVAIRVFDIYIEEYHLAIMAVAAPSDQIRQMVNFILQEAHEKANEIRVKVSTLLLD
jgi:hypothetical protein